MHPAQTGPSVTALSQVFEGGGFTVDDVRVTDLPTGRAFCVIAGADGGLGPLPG